MGEAAGAIAGGASMGLGGLTSAIGQKMQAMQAEDAAKANARQIRWESQIQSENATLQQRRLQSFNTVRVAKSGVRMEGSPLEVLAYNAGMAERNLSLQARAANLMQQRYRYMAQQAKLGGNIAFYSGFTTMGLGAISYMGSTGGLGTAAATGGSTSSAPAAASTKG
jgi:hypothetical protein